MSYDVYITKHYTVAPDMAGLLSDAGFNLTTSKSKLLYHGILLNY